MSYTSDDGVLVCGAAGVGLSGTSNTQALEI
jgi:hypothetical protein